MTPTLRIPRRLGRPPSHPWVGPFVRLTEVPHLSGVDLAYKRPPGTWPSQWRARIKQGRGKVTVGYGFSPIEALASVLLAAGASK